MSGFLKADRDIITQGKLITDVEREAKTRQRFSPGPSGINGSTKSTLLGKSPQLNARSITGKRIKGTIKPIRKFSPKGKAPLRPREEDLFDEQELEWEELPGPSFDHHKMSRARSEPRTMLDWSFFDWKPGPKFF